MSMVERPTKMTIYRGKDGKTLEECDILKMDAITPFQGEALGRLGELGLSEGEEVRILCNIPGFSLSYIWFKKDFPLPLHKHDADCLYYIIAGSIRLGNEELGPRDSFFLPRDVPYTYRMGPDGVELLEFRNETQVGIWFSAKTPPFWEKAAEMVTANRDAWATAPRPSEKAKESVL